MGTTISGDTGVVFPDATTQSTAVTVATPFSINASAGAGAQLRLPEATANGVNYVAVKAADLLAGDVTWTLPAADGTSGQYLQTNGAGQLSFATVPTTSPGGTTGQVQVNNAGAFGAISEGTSGQVLTSNGAGVAPSFATPSIGWTQIATFTPTGTFVTFSSIPQTYTDLFLLIDGVSHNSGANVGLSLQASYNNGTNTTSISILPTTIPSTNVVNGAYFVTGYTKNAMAFTGGVTYGASSTANFFFLTGGSPQLTTLVLGGTRTLNWLQLQWGGGNFDAGTVTLFGR